MKSTITTPDELTTLRIEGSSGTYKIFSSFRPMESPAFVDAVDRKYNLAEIKNLSGGKGYFLVHLNRDNLSAGICAQRSHFGDRDGQS